MAMIGNRLEKTRSGFNLVRRFKAESDRAIAAGKRVSRSPVRVVTSLPGLLSGKRVVRDTTGLPDSLGRIGSLEIRLARTVQDIRRAQRLRYQVFYDEMSAKPDARSRFSRRDIDAFDRVCDHLLVIDRDYRRKPTSKPRPRVVGTYRLLRQDLAERSGGFYSASEFDMRGLMEAHPGQRILELGRSCVLKPYRTKKTVELLWHGILHYVRHYKMDLMIGCASLEGTDPEALATQLSFIHHHARAPEAWRVSALPERYVGMNRMPKAAISEKAAIVALPPLIKGYLRLGATFGDGAVVDRQFGTTDVFVILRVADINPRYIEFYDGKGEQRAA